MQVNVEELSSIRKRLNFEIPAERVSAEIEKVFENIRKRTAIKGFRKGKVPKDLVEKNFREQMEGDVVKNLFNDAYFKYLQENKIYPVAYPDVETDQIAAGQPFKFSATIETYPEVKVEQFEGLEITRERLAVTDEMVDKRIAEVQENMAQLKPLETERPAALNDFATIDFVGYLDGTPFENGAAENHQLQLGSGNFIPGFEDQVVGMAVNEEKEIVVTFPEEYHSKDLAGKEVTFKVTLKDIKVKEVPALDDEFAKEVGEFETMTQLRDKVYEVFLKQEQDRIEADVRDRLIKALIEKNDFEIPQSFVDKQLDNMLENSKQRLAAQRMSLEMMGMNEELYRLQFRSVAESQVKGSLLLDALADKQGITLDEAEIDAKLREISGGNEQTYERMSTFYKTNKQAMDNLTHQLREDKALELLKSAAVVTEVDRQEAQKEE